MDAQNARRKLFMPASRQQIEIKQVSKEINFKQISSSVKHPIDFKLLDLSLIFNLKNNLK